MNTNHSSITPDATPGFWKQTIQRHPLLSFFILAYSFSWILSIPFILSEWGVLAGDYRIVFVIKSFGPFISALLVTRTLEGRSGVNAFRQRIRQWQARWHWYLFVLAGIPVLFMLALFLQPGALSGFQGFSIRTAVTYLMTFVLVAFGGGPLGEEPGWRGFALPRMQHTSGPLKGTLLLGVLWTFWHLPDFLTSAQGGGPGVPFSTLLINFVLFFVLVLSLAVIMTWVFNQTGGSIFIAILAHASVNTPQVALVPLFPAVNTTILDTAALISFGLCAVVILIVTRGTLGFKSA